MAQISFFHVLGNLRGDFRRPSEPGNQNLAHREFPGGPPSKYYPGATMLNFRDRTRTGVFIVL